MFQNTLATLAIVAMSTVAQLNMAVPASAYDEVTMKRVAPYLENIATHQERLEEASVSVSREREIVGARIPNIKKEIDKLRRERPYIDALPAEERAKAVRAHNDHDVDARSKALEVFSILHALDTEAVRTLIVEASGILSNLEAYAAALEQSGSPANFAEDMPNPAEALQVGTARVLSSLEEWGVLTQHSPRFQAVWSTSRMLKRAQEALNATNGFGRTASAVADQVVHVRSLIDQARIGLITLEAEGSLIEVAALGLASKQIENGMPGVTSAFEVVTQSEDRIHQILEFGLEDAGNDEPYQSDTGVEDLYACADAGICN